MLYVDFKGLIEDAKDGYGWFMKIFDGELWTDVQWDNYIKQATEENLIEKITVQEAYKRDLYQIDIMDEYEEYHNEDVFVIL